MWGVASHLSKGNNMYSDSTFFFDDDKEIETRISALTNKEESFFVHMEQTVFGYTTKNEQIYSRAKLTITLTREQIKSLIQDLTKAI